MSNSCSWDKIWLEAKDDKEFWWWVSRETQGVRGKKIVSYIEKSLGNINGLNIIEVGAGAGVYSLIFARYGASVTLLDISENALRLAQKFFDSVGVSASYVLGDAFNLDARLLGKFDVAMSFGTIEHFRYPERFMMAKSHIDLVRVGGIVIISAPNRLFFPHEILKLYLQRRNKWQLGYEGAFTIPELLQLGTGLGLENVEIRGSAFITDLLRYLYIFKSTHFFRRFFQVRPKRVFIHDLASIFDNLFGADISLMGCKGL